MTPTFELRYPYINSGTAGSTASWLPSKNPISNGTSFQEMTGFVADRLSDGKAIVGYQITDPFTIYDFAFDGLIDVDRTNLATFAAAVGAGPFAFKEGSCGAITTYRKVCFAPPQGYVRSWRRSTGSFYAVVVSISDAN